MKTAFNLFYFKSCVYYFNMQPKMKPNVFHDLGNFIYVQIR
jgi:hypothetical protein